MPDYSKENQIIDNLLLDSEEVVKYKNSDGDLHRENGPAVIHRDGYQAWFLDGKLHREDGPAVIGSNNQEEWFLNGKRHRVDGPAAIYPPICQEWVLNGVIHQTDVRKEWWIEGKQLSEEEFKKL